MRQAVRGYLFGFWFCVLALAFGFGFVCVTVTCERVPSASRFEHGFCILLSFSFSRFGLKPLFFSLLFSFFGRVHLHVVRSVKTQVSSSCGLHHATITTYPLANFVKTIQLKEGPRCSASSGYALACCRKTQWSQTRLAVPVVELAMACRVREHAAQTS